jgi:LemA protein
MEGLLLVFLSAAVIGLPVALIYVMTVYNKIVAGRHAYKRAWADVVTQERKKMKIIPALEDVVNSHQAYESGLLESITSLRSQMKSLDTAAVDAEMLEKVEKQTDSVMKGIRMTMEAYPELQTARLMNNLMGEIAEQQENIAAGIRVFNQNIEAFNNTIEMFPSSLVNRVINKETQQKLFQDSAASESLEFAPGAE